MQDVLAHYGKPVDTSRFPRMQRQVWSYRFAEDNVSYATMHFYFDPQGVLRLTQVVPDYLLESVHRAGAASGAPHAPVPAVAAAAGIARGRAR